MATALLLFGPEGAPKLRYSSPPVREKVMFPRNGSVKASLKAQAKGWGSRKYKACSVHTCSAGLPRS
jgi:hypothetical protein